MLIDTAMSVKKSMVGITTPLPPPPAPYWMGVSPEQRTRLEFLLKKIRIFGELNRYHNTAFIECLLNTGQDRREQFGPSPDCVAVVEDILQAAMEISADDEDSPETQTTPVPELGWAKTKETCLLALPTGGNQPAS